MKELSKLFVELVVMQFPGNRKNPDMTYENYYRRVKHAVNQLFKDFEKDQEEAIRKWLHMEPAFESKRLNTLREIAKFFPQTEPEQRPSASVLWSWYEWFMEALGD